MTVTGAVEARRYRFGPLDRGGWLLGLSARQCAALGSAVLLGGVLLHVTGSVAVAAVACAPGFAVAFARWDGRAVHEWLGPVAGWLALRSRDAHHWTMTPPLRSTPGRARPRPEFLAGLDLTEVAAPGPLPRAHGIGIISDGRGQRLSAVLRVRGREFALLERADQERVLDGWGNALAGFCRERSAVTRVAWSEWAAPASMDDHLAFIREHQRGADADVQRYLAMVADAGPLTTAHEVLLTISIDRRRITRTRNRGRDDALDVLEEELHLFARRLEHAGLVVDAPLSPAELAWVIRLRADPSCARRLATRAQTVGEAARVVSAHNWLPVAVATEWRHARVDHAWHRTFWIAEWPRLEAPADWMAPVVLHPGGIRSLTLVYEPVAPSRSRRAIDRDATRLASDEETRARRGFRIRAQHRRAETEVFAREAELVAGYAELAYAGFVTITAFDLEALDAQSAEWEQVAAQAGLELRALDGQHDLGFLTALPLGRGPAPLRFRA